MRFNPKARLDTSRVRDGGRGSAGGGMGGGMGGGGMRIPLPGSDCPVSGLIVVASNEMTSSSRTGAPSSS